MRAPVVSRIPKLLLVLLALALTASWAVVRPAVAGEGAQVLGAAGMGTSADAGARGPGLLASALATEALRVSADVALGEEPAEPVPGSFVVEGSTYAIVGKGRIALVAVAPQTLADGLVGGSAVEPDGAPLAEGDDLELLPHGATGQASVGAGSPQPSPEEVSSERSDGSALVVPESVVCDGVVYSVVAIGPRAFVGCDALTVAIPATVESVDEAAFWNSSVGTIEVAEGNPAYSSYDGMLFDADGTRLLLIPEGKQGAARIPKEAEVVPPSAFSHCAGVTAISVEAGSAAFSSWNGCLYDAAGETLLRAPAGATEVAIADGCATVAAGSLEGCAELGRIDASGSVRSVAPDALSSETGAPAELVASRVKVCLSDEVDAGPWLDAGFAEVAYRPAMTSADVLLGSAVAASPIRSLTICGNGCPIWEYIVYADGRSSLTEHNRTRLALTGTSIRFEDEKHVRIAVDGADGSKRRYWIHCFAPEDRYDYPYEGNDLIGWSATLNDDSLLTSLNSVLDRTDHWNNPIYAHHGWVEIKLRRYAKDGTYKADSPLPMWRGAYHKEKFGATPISLDTGYHCDGWYETTFGPDGKPVFGTKLVNEDRTYPQNTAFWGLRETTLSTYPKPNNYTVEFKSFDGTQTYTTETFEYDKQAAAIPGDNGPRWQTPGLWADMQAYEGLPDYECYGWSRTQGSSRPDYAFEQKAPNISTERDDTVTVFLAKAKREAVFDPNGGTLRTHVMGTDHWTGTKDPNKQVITWVGATTVGADGTSVYYETRAGEGVEAKHMHLERTGYRTTGWDATNRFGDELGQDEWSGKMIEAGGTYTARWEPIECAVTLDPNGGSGGTASVRATYDQVLPAASMPVRPGFKFEGYYDSPTGGTCYYRSDGQPVTAWDKDQDKCTLYAFWTEGSFAAGTTTIDVNGYDRAPGSFVDRDLTDIDGVARLSHWPLTGNPSADEDFAIRGCGSGAYWAGSRLVGGTVEYKDPWPTGERYHSRYAGRFRSGYLLALRDTHGFSDVVDVPSAGWARDPEGRARLPEGYVLTEDEGTIYAIWPSYAMRLIPNGGSGEPQARGTVGKVLPDIPEEDLPTRLGYSFDGYWIRNESTEAHPGMQCWEDGALCLYGPDGKSSYVWDFNWGAGALARWDANAYRVAFDPAGGAWDDAAAGKAVSAAFDQDVTLAAAPKRSGYLFAGWEATGPDGAAYSFDAGATLAGGKLKAAEGDVAAVPISYGERAVEGQEPATTATFTAKWVADLRVDVPISVDLDLTVDWEQGRVVASGPDGSGHATGEFRSWSSGEVQVAAFGQEAGTAMGHRQGALGLFASGDEAKAGNLMKVSLVLSADADGAQRLSFPLSGLYELPADRPPHGAMASPQDLSSLDLVVPPASSVSSPGTLRVRYGIDCAADLPLSDVAIDDRSRPILRLVYMVGLAGS